MRVAPFWGRGTRMAVDGPEGPFEWSCASLSALATRHAAGSAERTWPPCQTSTKKSHPRHCRAACPVRPAIDGDAPLSYEGTMRKGAVAIAGFGLTPQGKVYDRTHVGF